MIEKWSFEWDSEKEISIKIELKWSDWFNLTDLLNDKIQVPDNSGVYEIRLNDECFDIGKALSLNTRMLQQLIKNRGKHSTRDRMKKENVDFNNLKVRWVETDYPAALEEYLHKMHKKQFGILPKYVKQ